MTSSMASSWSPTKLQLLYHTYLWPPILCHSKAMEKGKIEAMATKFSKKFAISMLKKHRKFYRCGLTHLDATPIFKNRSVTYGPPCSIISIFFVNTTCQCSVWMNQLYHYNVSSSPQGPEFDHAKWFLYKKMQIHAFNSI